MKDLFAALEKTKNKFSLGFKERFQSSAELDESSIENLETLLLSSDVGVTASQRIISDLKARVRKDTLMSQDLLSNELKESMINLLEIVEKPLSVSNESPYVILIIGANGAGKTTTCGKLAKFFTSMGRSVMLASGDTFRAAATSQLDFWGEKIGVPVVSQGHGADSASVIYDAFTAAKSRDLDVLIADTAGRLQNKTGLMEELKKIKRVISKIDSSAPHEVLLVLDSGVGQNAIDQVRIFHEMIGVSGLVLTKLDGTAKGGVVFSLAHDFKIPIRFIGLGEKEDQLKIFNAKQFVEGIFT
ncbi:MAG: signal recognition particle-docking protein FtsY [Gammaproteobacteria bacterium TMED180]|nr:MAG: signal recognition particle-docking protein FtsY [Gammaproteobacteria bacterium TMED180]